MSDQKPKDLDVNIKEPIVLDYLDRIKKHIKLIKEEDLVIHEYQSKFLNLIANHGSKALRDGNLRDQKKQLKKAILKHSKALTNKSLKIGKGWLDE